MLNIDMRKIYNFYPFGETIDPANLPSGGDLYYECQDCAGIISSVSHIKSACTCGNLAGGGGRVDVRDPERVNVVRGRLK